MRACRQLGIVLCKEVHSVTLYETLSWFTKYSTLLHKSSWARPEASNKWTSYCTTVWSNRPKYDAAPYTNALFNLSPPILLPRSSDFFAAHISKLSPHPHQDYQIPMSISSVVEQGLEWRRQHDCKNWPFGWFDGNAYIGSIVNQAVLVGGILTRPRSCIH